jgi:hypothetical protein
MAATARTLVRYRMPIEQMEAKFHMKRMTTMPGYTEFNAVLRSDLAAFTRKVLGPP